MSLYSILTEKPWQNLGSPQSQQASAALPPQRVALRFFLGVVGVMFALFMVAYYIRMELSDWRPMPESPQLWVNTAILIASSIILQWTRQQAGQERRGRVHTGLLLGGASTLLFVLAQLSVWGDMQAQGYFVYSNPANAFFYVLTGIHGLHLLGGLWVWCRATVRLWSGAALPDIRLSIELCSVYWHFLLLVWLVLFALMSYS